MMEKYVVQIEMRTPMTTQEAKKEYGTKADMNQITYARGNCYSFGYTNDIAMAKAYNKYDDAAKYAIDCMFNYWGNRSTIARVVKCEVVMNPVDVTDVELTTVQKLDLFVKEDVDVTIDHEELEAFAKTIENWPHAQYLLKTYLERKEIKL